MPLVRFGVIIMTMQIQWWPHPEEEKITPVVRVATVYIINSFSV
jgi:hypothetical protein